MTDLPPVLTPKQIMEVLDISENRVYDLLRLSPEHGGIKCARIQFSDTGKPRIRVRREWFLEWLDRQAGIEHQHESA